MILDFYFYVFYSYFLKKIPENQWMRACGVVCISIGGILNVIFILLREYQIANVFHHLIFVRLAVPVILFLSVYFLFGYKKREEIILQKFLNNPVDSPINRSLCWITFILCIVIPMLLAVLFREGGISSIPWTSKH
jgi:UDP-N-acetylmuramyl pentapeptide phosphotransferase/UDP-N-acetylglucosamine-1-phosphate transferase